MLLNYSFNSDKTAVMPKGLFRRSLSLVLAVVIGGILSISMAPQVASANGAPINDNISAATTLDRNGPTKTLAFSNDGATLETGEVAITEAGFSAWHGSVWFKMSPGAAGAIVMGATSDFDTILAVYTFTQPNNYLGATQIAYNDDYLGDTVQSQVSFTADATSTYYIVVGGFAQSSKGSGTLIWTFVPTNNDNISGARTIDRDAVTKTLSTTNTGATLETGEELIRESDSGPWGASIWFMMTPSTAGFVEMNTLGSAFDTILAVYTFTDSNSYQGATQIAYNDDDGESLQSSVAFKADGTSTYYIVVGGFSDRSGNITLTWAVPTIAENNDIEDATLVNATGQTLTGISNYDANVETNEAAVANASNQFDGWSNSVWFKVTPTAGTYGIQTTSNNRLDLVVLNSATFNAGNVVQRSSTGISFNALGGVTYYIGVSGQQQKFSLIFRSAVRPGAVTNVQLVRGPITTVSWTAAENFDVNVHEYVVRLTNENAERECRVAIGTTCGLPRLGNGTWELDVYAEDAAINLGSDHYVENSVVILNTSNDYFAAAVSLLIDSGQTLDFIGAATRENDEPSHQDEPTFSSVWYTYTPTTAGTSTFSVAETAVDDPFDINPVVSVFTGTQLANLQSVAVSPRSVSWQATAGQRYYVAVSSIENFAHRSTRFSLFDFSLTWTLVPPPQVVETPAIVPTPQAVATPAPASTVAAPKVTRVKVANNTVMTSILKKAKIKLPRNSTVTYKVAKSSRKMCSISNNKIQFKKKGTCNMVAKVKPKRGASVSHQLAVRN
jgi:hypothetical protein